MLRPFVRIPTIAPVPHRALLYLSGSQASEFLNGILASTVPRPRKGPFYSAFLHAQGRVVYDVLLYSKANAKGEDGYIIEYDSRPSEAPSLVSFIRRFILRSKVKLQDVSNEYQVWAAWGSEHPWETPRKWHWARSYSVEPDWSEEPEWPWGVEDGVIRDRRAVGMGRRMLVPHGELPKEQSTHDLADSEAYTLHRILHCVPEGVVDIPPMHAFPMESNLDIMGGLDFRKGCYVGQELTVRTYHTGSVRKRIFPVEIRPEDSSSGDLPEPHAVIRPTYVEQSDSKPRPRGTGTLLSVSRGYGLAQLRLGHVLDVHNGNMKFEIQSGIEGQQNKNWTATPWWPDWWPEFPTQSETS